MAKRTIGDFLDSINPKPRVDTKPENAQSSDFWDTAFPDLGKIVVALGGVAAVTLVVGGGAIYLVSQIDKLIPEVPTPIAQVANTATFTPEPTIEATLTPTSVEKFRTIGLDYEFAEYRENNLGLPAGEAEFLGIPFEVGYQLNTKCEVTEDRSDYYRIYNINLENPLSVNLLIQAGNAFVRYEGEDIGEVILKFTDMDDYVVPLTLGYNIRDWARERAINYVLTENSPDLYPVQEGTAPDGRLGGIDLLKIDIPDKYLDSILYGIEFRDTAPTEGNTSPCIHILGVTIEYLD